jgi:MOSC domain
METLLNPNVRHLSIAELEAALDHIRQTPRDEGVLELIVRRPQIEQREILNEADLDPERGLMGDNWVSRGSSSTVDGSPNPEMQINIMNSRVAALVAQDKNRWQLAGDQLFVDMELSKTNLPVGCRLSLGSAVIEVTAPPHTGCKKFVARFGRDAMMFVNSTVGRELCLRGINARVIEGGAIRVGQLLRKL